jgi:microcystin-dependent protein
VPADTYTAGGAGIILMGTGNDNNNWGTLLNTQGLQIIEDALTGTVSFTVTGGALDLSVSPPPAAPSQARFSHIILNGALTSTLTVFVPNLPKWWFVENSTNGAFPVFFKAIGSNTIEIPFGTMKIVVSSGAAAVRRLDAQEVGEIADFACTSPPAGYMECNGAAVSRANHPDLFNAIGTTWGAGDGATTFNLPNFTDTGRFRRARTASVAVGTYQSNQNAAHTHTGQATGTTDATNIDHTHNYSGTTGTESAAHTHTAQGSLLASAGIPYNTVAAGTAFQLNTAPLGTESALHTHAYGGTTAGMNQSNPHTHTFTSGVFTTSSSGGSEARPETAVVLTCIRY